MDWFVITWVKAHGRWRWFVDRFSAEAYAQSAAEQFMSDHPDAEVIVAKRVPTWAEADRAHR